MTTEAPQQKAIWLASAAIPGAKLFRANSGKAWVGGKPSRLQDGTVCLPAGRPIALGLALADGSPVVGQGDLLGWRTITITPEMVGARVAVFASVECKREKGGRTSADQLHWCSMVQQAGGIAGVANTPAVAQSILRDWTPPV